MNCGRESIIPIPSSSVSLRTNNSLISVTWKLTFSRYRKLLLWLKNKCSFSFISSPPRIIVFIDGSRLESPDNGNMDYLLAQVSEGVHTVDFYWEYDYPCVCKQFIVSVERDL